MEIKEFTKDCYAVAQLVDGERVLYESRIRVWESDHFGPSWEDWDDAKKEARDKCVEHLLKIS